MCMAVVACADVLHRMHGAYTRSQCQLDAPHRGVEKSGRHLECERGLTHANQELNDMCGMSGVALMLAFLGQLVQGCGCMLDWKAVLSRVFGRKVRPRPVRCRWAGKGRVKAPRLGWLPRCVARRRAGAPSAVHPHLQALRARRAKSVSWSMWACQAMVERITVR